ncbi:MAG: PstS family phosphate ABC transporter substrate-binding protein, partial [Candidatus Bipolaricaulia bacterium]
DYWAGRYGLDKFGVQVGLSHSGDGLRKVSRGNVDIGNSSTAVRFEYPGKTEEELSGYTPHVVGYDRQAFSVSREVYEAGCTVLTKKEIVGIFKGSITNWKGVNACNYDKEIQAVGRAVGSGTETMFRVNIFGRAEVSGLKGVDIRQGQNQMVKRTLISSDNAIGYPGVQFISDDNPAIAITWDDGNTYSIEDQNWPLSRPLY